MEEQAILVCDRRHDRMISPKLEEAEAQEMKAKSITISSSHVVMLSHPAEVAAFIEGAAQRIRHGLNETRKATGRAAAGAHRHHRPAAGRVIRFSRSSGAAVDAVLQIMTV